MSDLIGFTFYPKTAEIRIFRFDSEDYRNSIPNFQVWVDLAFAQLDRHSSGFGGALHVEDSKTGQNANISSQIAGNTLRQSLLLLEMDDSMQNSLSESSKSSYFFNVL